MHQVVAIEGTTVRLVAGDGRPWLAAAAYLMGSLGFEVVGGPEPGQGPVLPPFAMLDTVTEAVAERARSWESHILEVLTGLPADAAEGQRPRPEFDPRLRTVTEREAAKAAERTAPGEPVSVRTLTRMRLRYQSQGLWGLVDHRNTRPATPFGRVDERVVEAIAAAMDDQAGASTGTRERAWRRAKEILAARHPGQEVPLPSRDRLPGDEPAGRRPSHLRVSGAAAQQRRPPGGAVHRDGRARGAGAPTKGGLAALTRSLAIEYASRSIRVNAVSPGIIQTPGAPGGKPPGTRRPAAPLGQAGQISDVVDGISFLESSPYITGEIRISTAARSLLHRSDDDQVEPRVSMLETIREYALERLAARGEATALRDQHAGYFMALAEQAESLLSGPQQGMWFKRLDVDLDNLRAALAWSAAQRQPETTARLAEGLRLFWEDRGPISEGLQWLDAALEHRASLLLPTLAKVLSAKAALLLLGRGDHQQATPLLEESLRLFRELGDTSRVVRSLSHLGLATMLDGDRHRSATLNDQAVALARKHDDREVLSLALGNQGNFLRIHEDLVRASVAMQESLVLAREVGDLRGIAHTLNSLAGLALHEEDYGRAIPLLEEALALGHQKGSPALVAHPLLGLGLAALYHGEHDRAAALIQESLTLARGLGDHYLIKDCLWGMAGIAAAQGHASRAVRLWAMAATLDRSIGISTPDQLPPIERLLSTVRAQLNEDAFEAEFAKGRATSMDEAVTYALQPPSGAE